jgi:hypothetical protein
MQANVSDDPYGADCPVGCQCLLQRSLPEEETFLCLGCEHTYLISEAVSISARLHSRKVGRCNRQECRNGGVVSEDEQIEAGHILKEITTTESWYQFMAGVDPEHLLEGEPMATQEIRPTLIGRERS